MSTVSCGPFLLSSEFDSGNFLKVEYVPEQPPQERTSPSSSTSPALISPYAQASFKSYDHEINIWTRPDCYGTPFENGNRTWFFFSIRGGKSHQLVKFNVLNLNKQVKLFQQGMQPVYQILPEKPGWDRVTDRLLINESGEHVCSISFKLRLPDSPSTSTLYIAFTYPYTYHELCEFLNSLDESFLPSSISPRSYHLHHLSFPSESIYYHRECCCLSLEGRRVELITVSSPNGISSEREERLQNLFPFKNELRPFKFPEKKVVFMSARVHPGETPSSFVLNGFLKFILQENDPRAVLLRRLFVFKFIPILNPDGVVKGHYRTDPRGVNLNRVYLAPSPTLHPPIYAARKLLLYYHLGYEMEDDWEYPEGIEGEEKMEMEVEQERMMKGEGREGAAVDLEGNNKGAGGKKKPYKFVLSGENSLCAGCGPFQGGIMGGDEEDAVMSVEDLQRGGSGGGKMSACSSSISSEGIIEGVGGEGGEGDGAEGRGSSGSITGGGGGSGGVGGHQCAFEACDEDSVFYEKISLSQTGSRSSLVGGGRSSLQSLEGEEEEGNNKIGGGEGGSGGSRPASSTSTTGGGRRKKGGGKGKTKKGRKSLKSAGSSSSLRGGGGGGGGGKGRRKASSKPEPSSKDSLMQVLGSSVVPSSPPQGPPSTRISQQSQGQGSSSSTGGGGGRYKLRSKSLGSLSPSGLGAGINPINYKITSPVDNGSGPESGLFLYLDMHGHTTKRGIFMYGNHFPEAVTQAECMLLPKLMSINSPHFDFSACNFTERLMCMKDKKDGASREGSGRVACLKLTGLIRSYTLECNYNTGRIVNPIVAHRGPSLPHQLSTELSSSPYHSGLSSNYVPPKYTIGIFEGIGKALGESLLDQTGHNPWSRLGGTEYRSLDGVRRSLVKRLKLSPEYRNSGDLSGAPGGLRKGLSSTPYVQAGGSGGGFEGAGLFSNAGYPKVHKKLPKSSTRLLQLGGGAGGGGGGPLGPQRENQTLPPMQTSSGGNQEKLGGGGGGLGGSLVGGGGGTGSQQYSSKKLPLSPIAPVLTVDPAPGSSKGKMMKGIGDKLGGGGSMEGTSKLSLNNNNNAKDNKPKLSLRKVMKKKSKFLGGGGGRGSKISLEDVGGELGGGGGGGGGVVGTSSSSISVNSKTSAKDQEPKDKEKGLSRIKKKRKSKKVQSLEKLAAKK